MKQKFTQLLLLFICVLNVSQVKAQTGLPLSPSALMDTVFDRFGNKYGLRDVVVDTTLRFRGSALSKTTQLCSAGYFDLYFETGSGMEGSSTAETNRRNVICQVFSDISAFIGSPLNTTGNKVKIWVRDVTQIPGFSSGILGLASSYYNVPTSTSVSGIADNEIWKTIHTGYDSYTNVTSPLMSMGGSGSSGFFYHGMMAFNFSQPWNTTLAIPSNSMAPTDYDLYSVALHEITHALGFTSLINFNGTSKFGSGYNYYGRYDLFLRNSSNTQSLITNSGSCSLYNYQFNSALTTTVLAAGNCVSTSGSTDNTACSVAVQYVGTSNVPVYTPNCFEGPSSLGHFEDQCYTNTVTSLPYGNNLYFNMCNGQFVGSNSFKRYLKPEERLVLCDIGYSVTTTYGSSGNFNNFSYGGSSCAGLNVSGLNDGITSLGAFAYMGNLNSAISISSILANDVNADSFECLQDITGTSTLSATSGISSTTITLTSSLSGVHLLRYIPFNSSSGVRGNITYIYVYVQGGTCSVTSCNMINNGGFESSNTCGQLGFGTSTPSVVVTTNCWTQCANTPDVIQRNCTNTAASVHIPMNVPTPMSNPSSDSWNGTPNSTFIGLWSGAEHSCEALQSTLNTPLVQNGVYTLSFRAKVANNNPTPGANGIITIAASNTMLAPIFAPFTSLPSAMTSLGTFSVTNDNIWHNYVQTFTFTPSLTLNNLIVMNTTNMNILSGQSANYIYIDDVSLMPATQYIGFDLPNTALCLSNNIADLSVYLSPTSSGGVFSGAGVGLTSGGTYSLNGGVAGVGNHNISYTYTNNIGCQITVVDNILIANPASFTISASIIQPVVCSGSVTTLSATGATTYTWMPGSLNGMSVTITPTASTVYTVTGTVCTGTAQTTLTVTVNPTPTITAIASNYTICSGQTTTLTAAGASTYTWNPGNLIGLSVPVSPTVTTTYTVTGRNICGITSTQTVNINVNATPVLTITASNPVCFPGQSVTLTVSGASTYAWVGGATTATVTANPLFYSTLFGVTGFNANGCSSYLTYTVFLGTVPSISVTPSTSTICPGSTATITASGVNTYSWSTGDFGATINITPTISATYSVVGTNTATGCTASQNFSISVWSPPNGVLTPNGSISLCGTQTITLNATSVQDPNTSYSWTYNGSAAGSGNNINVSSAGQYVVTITNTITGCVRTYSTPVYNAPNYVCDQCLVPNGDFEYAASLSNITGNITDAPFWNSPTGNGSPDYFNTGMTLISGMSIPNNVFASNTPDHTGNINQAYAGFINYATNVSQAREYIQTPLNCALEPNQKYNVSLWARAANGNRHISNNVGIHFSNTAITGTSDLYSFTPQFNFTSLVPATAWTQLTGTLTGSSAGFITIGNFYNDAATTFSVINAPSIFQNAYYFIDDVSVTPAPPSFTVSAGSCITSGSAVTLTLSGSPGYYVTNGVTTQTLNSATGTVAVSPTVTTTYTITPKLNCVKCNIFSVVTISVTPVVSVSNATICSGQTTTLTASGATTYSWNTGATTSSISVSPTSTTNYTITGTSSGCSNTKTVSVTVKQTPTVTAVASPTAICVSQSVTLTAGGASTYTWLPSSQTTTVITVTPSVNTTYTVTGTNSVGCTATKTVNVIVYSNTPTVTVNSSFASICGTSAATMIASGANNYTWTPTGGNSATAIVTPTAVTVYTVRGSNGASCGASTKTVIVSPTSSLCCSTTTNVVGTSLTSSVNIASGTYAVAGTVIDMQGVITFTGNTSFNGYTFRMKAGTLLRVVGEYTLSLINCKLFSCSELWDGISLPAFNNDIHGHLLLNNTTVEDMYNGIVVEGNNWAVVTPTTGILISSTNSKLNKNYISMQFRNLAGMFHTPTMTYTSTPYPFTMVTTTISSYASATSPAPTLKPSTISTYTYAYNTIAGGASSSTNTPYVSFPRAYKGIVLNNLASLPPLVIGDSVNAGNTNTFDNMDFGIHGTEATAKVHNNYFKNITGSAKQTANGESFPAFGPDEIGIAVAMTHTSTNVHALTVGTHTVIPSSNPYPKGNKFEDCNRGVYAISCKNVYAKANTFTATATSTVPVYGTDAYHYYKNQSAIWVNALADYGTLSYNHIRNFSSGIYSSHTTTNTAIRPYILKNDIASPSSTGFCKQAIQVGQVGGSNIIAGNYRVEDNSITRVYNGILIGGVGAGVMLKNNSVSIESTAKILGASATSTRTAVKVSSSPYTLVQANNITSNVGSTPTTSTAAAYLVGIHVITSANSKIECNTTYHTGRDFVFQGSCANSSWKVNTMYDSYRGLEMNNSAVIGQQGGTGSPNLSANTWTTVIEETYVFLTNPNITSRLYLLNNVGGGNPKTLPTANYPTASGSRYQTGALNGLQVTTGTSYSCNAGNAQRITNGNSGGNTNGGNNQKTTGSATDSLTELTNLAMADEDSYEVFADEMMYQNKQFVYQLIAQDSISPVNGSTLDAFYNSNQNTAIGRLTEVQTAIANFDTKAANMANEAAPVLSSIEQKQQRANTLTLKYMDDRNYQFSDAEKVELQNLANECLVKGTYVAQARNLVDVFTHTTILYDDDCEAEANASRKKKVTNVIDAQTSFNLFPNPNNGAMQLDYNLGGYGTAKFNLFDITGKLVQTKNIETNEGSLYINEQSLKNGVYFYTILVGEKNIKTDKIVIIK